MKTLHQLIFSNSYGRLPENFYTRYAAYPFFQYGVGQLQYRSGGIAGFGHARTLRVRPSIGHRLIQLKPFRPTVVATIWRSAAHRRRTSETTFVGI